MSLRASPPLCGAVVTVPWFAFGDDEAEGGEPPLERDHMCPVVELLGQRRIFLTLGALLDDGTVLCTQLHTCDLAPAGERADIVPREAKGSAEELAAFTADWFGEVPRLPTLEYDGRRDGPPAVT
ncbi:hypothetical protein ABT187_01515 [Streptomyces sp. NPDC001817]|uniref:hypothetical protein n=1 Tax=Streptomyces sp. NPDC001817 TaxID=3154398 RepID=UPI0033307A30